MEARKNHQCDRKNSSLVSVRRSLAARALAWLAGISILLAGCSGPGFLQKKPTAVSLAKAAVENVQKAESVAVDMDLDAALNIRYDQLGIGMKVDLGADVDMEMTRNPQLARGSQIIELQVMGQNQEIRGRFYLDPTGGNETTYLQWGDGKWKKKTKTADAQNASGSMNVLQSIGLVKAIAEEAMRAELLEETVTVNDKEAWQIDCTLTGDFLQSVMDSFGNSDAAGTGDTVPFDLSGVDWSKVEIPARICIYQETGLPARIHMDCRSIGKELVGGMTKDSLGDLPIGSISLDVEDCEVDLTLDRYDEIAPIEIPREALQAEESENLAPDLEGLLGW